jgi:hypothetical protein
VGGRDDWTVNKAARSWMNCNITKYVESMVMDSDWDADNASIHGYAWGLSAQCPVINNSGRNSMRKKAGIIGICHLAVLVAVCTACDEQELLDAEADPSDDPSAEFRALGCATLYWDGSFLGSTMAVDDGANVSWIGDQWNDKVSSVRVSPGCALNIWSDGSYAGAHKTVAGVVPWIGSDWNDKVSAFTCSCA